MMTGSTDVQETVEVENLRGIGNNEIDDSCDDIKPLELIQEVPRSRRRGKALAWKYVKTFENMEVAMEQY